MIVTKVLILVGVVYGYQLASPSYPTYTVFEPANTALTPNKHVQSEIVTLKEATGYAEGDEDISDHDEDEKDTTQLVSKVRQCVETEGCFDMYLETLSSFLAMDRAVSRRLIGSFSACKEPKCIEDFLGFLPMLLTLDDYERQIVEYTVRFVGSGGNRTSGMW